MRKLIANNPVQRFKISKKQSGGIMYTPGIYNKSTNKFTPNGLTYSDAREALKSTIPIKNTSDLSPVYNRQYIRSQRDNYSDVNSYYDYITNNQDSNEAKLWNRVLGTLDTPEAKRQAFDQIMGAYGIKGNLGRRDSKRLSNVLNTIKGIATDNDTQNAYLKSYENAMANELIKRQPVQANIAQSEAMKITPLRTPVKPTYNPDFRINTDLLSRSNLFAKRGGILRAQNGMTFKQAWQDARNKKQRYFNYNGKMYNSKDKGNDTAYESFIDNMNEMSAQLASQKAPGHLGWEINNDLSNEIRGTDREIKQQGTESILPTLIVIGDASKIKKNKSNNSSKTRKSTSRNLAGAYGSPSGGGQQYANQREADYAKDWFGKMAHNTSGFFGSTAYKTWTDPKDGQTYRYITRNGVNYLDNGRYWNPRTKEYGQYKYQPGLFGKGIYKVTSSLTK